MIEPRWTQRQTAHLNGGSKWSGFEYEIERDGRPTGVMLSVRTNGRRGGYRVVSRILTAPDEATFDLIATDGIGVTDWLLAHMRKFEVIEGGNDGGGSAGSGAAGAPT